MGEQKVAASVLVLIQPGVSPGGVGGGQGDSKGPREPAGSGVCRILPGVI